MSDPNIDRLRSYLQLISRNKGLESVLKESAASDSGLEMAEPAQKKSARTGLEMLLSRRNPSADQAAGIEALILPKLRPAIDVVEGKFQVVHSMWVHLSTNADIRKRIEDVIPSVGRIELPGNPRYPYGGTGFVVGDGLLMTNRHVAAIFAAGMGTRTVDFRPGHKAGINFLQERNRPHGQTLDVRRVVMIHPYWDMAILAVDNLPPNREPLKLSLIDISALDGHEIAVIGYPAFDPRNDAAEQDELFDREYGIKRLQPGLLHGRASTESYGKVVSAAAHDCSTLGGNSGSCVLDLISGQVVALHFGGRYQEKNFAVPTFELARDGRVVDTGIHFASTPPSNDRSPSWANWWTKADMLDPAEYSGSSTSGKRQSTSARIDTNRIVQVAVDGGTTIEDPIRVTVSIGSPGTRTEIDIGDGLTEALVEPWRDTQYESRTGYDKDFLEVEVPLPEAVDPSVLAPTLQGGNLLHYQHFSIAVHAERRLALITAANVTADQRLKKPDPRKTYTRRVLTGLGERDQERWFVDPRMDQRHQLPDVFFTRDRGAFDKGHIVRRDDVAWGKTYEDLRRANGDTYHVTNCSPQTAEFNRSGSGEDNWGDLENQVLASAAAEKLVLFAGPVLDPSDEVFLGAGGGRVKIRAKIPSRFWKVIVAKTENGLAAFGFVLEQDLSRVEFEYVVAEEFAPFMYPLSEIEMMTGVRFPPIVLEADQYNTVRGAEVAMHAGTQRRRLRRR